MTALRIERLLDFADVVEGHAFARLAGVHREVVETEHDVLRRHDDRLAVRGRQDVVGRHHQHAGFELSFQRSGTWTAIWSPSKSALNAVQTSGCSWIALPSISTGSNA